MVNKITGDAPTVWKYLNGIVCLYKPPLASPRNLRMLVLNKLATDMNELQCRKPRKYVEVTGDTSKPLDVHIRQSYADHPLVLGPRYLPEDFKARFAKSIGPKTSGVCVLGINRGTRNAFYLDQCNPLCTYHITGQFGLATNDLFVTGKTIYRCNVKYITKPKIDHAVAAIQANHQKSLMTAAGFDPQSQTAYEVAATGLIRPLNKKVPVIYGIKCIKLDLPYFTLEVVSINENEEYLLNMVDEIGHRLKNVATTTAIKCIRYSFFTIEHALLKKHITLQNVLDNMAHSNSVLKKNKNFGIYLKQQVEEEEKFYMENVNDGKLSWMTKN